MPSYVLVLRREAFNRVGEGSPVTFDGAEAVGRLNLRASNHKGCVMLQGPVEVMHDRLLTSSDAHRVALIDDRRLVAECLLHCLRERRPQDHISVYSSVFDWVASCGAGDEEAIVILCTGARKADDAQVQSALSSLHDACPGSRVIIMADWEDAQQVLQVLEQGACGYIPTSMSLDVTINAILLVGVGGTFIPASSLTSSRNAIRADASPLAIAGVFTARQAAVVEALRKGKANKIIAYELNMRESTVKVHVRNIMKKLKAKNRTEVAFITNSQENITYRNSVSH